MAQCGVLQPAGSNQNCLLAASEIKSVLICDKDVIFTYAQMSVLSNWTTKVTQDLTINASTVLDSYNVTTDDPNIVTGAVSKSKKVTNTPVPSFEIFLDSNVCDFKQALNTLKGGTYGMFYILQNGSILGTIDQSGSNIGSFKPLRATITANTKGIQEVDSTQAFRVYVNHTSYKEWENQFYFEPIWDSQEIIDAMPIGLNMIMTAVYAAGDQVVQVKTRCEGNYVGLVVGDFDEDETQGNVDTPAITAIVDDGGGAYTLTAEKDVVPANLVDGDVLACRVKILSGSDVTHISNYIYIEGVT
ncbi:hypothetical protein KAR91_25505 [Candidatus Pacearchaeota archaeon]|nr:hypothetical protein [Candidatus Pacearchaeota archaeon]